jgi:type I restriction enzyme S subunit
LVNDRSHSEVKTVSELVADSKIFVEDGNHGENRPRQDEFCAQGVPFLRPPDLKEGRVDFRNCDHINEDGLRRVRKGIGKPGDIILTHRATVGRIAITDDSAPSVFVTNPGTTIWRSLDPGFLDQRYLYFFMSSKIFQDRLFSEVGHTSTFDYVSLTQQRTLPVVIPDIQTQRDIAHILGTLDDKIELSRKTNETLEAMAKALFKSWFVDFDPVRAKAEGRPTGLPEEISDLFPDSFEDSELGEIPSGWEVGGLEKFLVLQRGFDLPATQRIKGAYPVVAASGISGTHNEPIAPAPGVVTGRSGVLGKVFYIQTDFFPLNTTLWAKEFRLATPIYGYFLLCDIDFAVFNAGSAVPTLNRNHLVSLRFPLPPKALIDAFTEVADNLMRRKEEIVAETSNLSATRDALLPKLISGEIRIPDAQRLLEEAGI